MTMNAPIRATPSSVARSNRNNLATAIAASTNPVLVTQLRPR
ncbi:Uncharacterised protein [Mycobacteroides abscessus subsp. abscessus]|nr:Uncharacterised protein [Mycobacteroides abscessus subsp. abscessus]